MAEICTEAELRQKIIDWAKENHSVNVNDGSSYTRNSYWQSGANFLLPYYGDAVREIEELKADNLRLQNALADAKVENEILRADYLQVISTGDMFKTSDWVSGTWKNHLMNYRKVTEAEYLTYINKQESK